MLTKTLLFTVLAACGVQSTPATAPDIDENAKAAAAAREFMDAQMQMQMQLYNGPDEPDKAPPEEPELKEQHFCCQSVNHKTKSGDGCDPISGSLETIAACNKVLYCPGFWTKDDGKVTCE
jgi:hypothetical protein